MRYQRIDIHVERAGIEPVLAALMQIGITDAVVEDPADVAALMEKKHSYDWDYIDPAVLAQEAKPPRITVYLPAPDAAPAQVTVADIERVLADVRREAAAGLFGPDAVLGPLTMEVSEEDDSLWKDNWKTYFLPKKVGRRLVVKPTWYDYEGGDDDLVIELDPGMAFGTGTHETTSLCLRLMEEHLRPGDRVLDVGCGSGILSIAAARLGAASVLGVEIDPQAAEVARENVARNGVGDVVRVMEGDLTQGVAFRGELVVANLMADLIVRLSPDVGKHLLPGGLYIASGILLEKRDAVAGAIRGAGFAIEEIREDGMWCAIAARPAG